MGKSLQQLRDSVGTGKDENLIPVRYIESSKVYKTTEVRKETYSTDNVFILGNEDYGVLGTNKLGKGETPTIETKAVLNSNNIFVDRYNTNDFVDTTNTTGTASTNYYQLDEGDILQSQIIAKNNEQYEYATVSVEGTSVSQADYYLSADGGTNWESVTLGEKHFFNNSTIDGIKYKIEVVDTTESNKFPLTFPITLTTLQTKIDKIRIKYN